MQLAHRVWDFSTSLDLLHPGDQVVIGVSGGPDSLCLLEVLHGLAARHRLTLHVAHLNHGLRPEAAAEAEFVRAEALARGCRFMVETVNVAAAAQTNKQSLEMAARALRYDFLRRAAQQAGAGLVAVAHTADDQAETVLMRMLRGTGLRGLRGMAPKRLLGEPGVGRGEAAQDSSETRLSRDTAPVFLVRPLLRTTRSDVLAYCAQHNLEPRIDRSNEDVRYARNRVRHELMPALEAYNPRIRQVLCRMAEAAAGDYEVWLGAVQRLWLRTARANGGGQDGVAFDRKRWLALSGPQQRALLRAAVEQLTGKLEEIDFTPIEAAAAFARRDAPGRSCEVAKGLVLRLEPKEIRLTWEAQQPEPPEGPLVEAGRLSVGWQLAVERLGPGAWSQAEAVASPRWTAYLDADRVQGPLTLRARRPGDRFQPLGMQGHTVRLADFFANQKVPARRRSQWPLLACGEAIVWVMGLRVDERYKVTSNTRSVLRLSLAGPKPG